MSALTTDASFWSKIARKYAANPISNMEGYLNTLERTKSHLALTDNALEIGCGTGSTALLLAPYVAHMTATDLAPGMIEIANEKRVEENTENVTFKTAEISELKVEDGPYDAVLAHNLLHLIPDLDAALAHIATLVVRDGVFISKTVCEPHDGGGWKFKLTRSIALPIAQVFGKAPFVNFLKAQEVDAKIEAAGFKIIETADQAGFALSRYVVARKL